ncbi:MAG: hypothetical protein R3F65_33615 [bacterium]
MTVSWPLLTRIDAEWPPERPAGALHRDWRWVDWVREERSAERFVLVDEADAPQLIWCCASRRLLRLPGGPFYRPDRLEVAPMSARSGVGTVGMAVIATRARELGANGVVLKATLDAAPFYAKVGGVAGEVAGWSHSPDLVEFTFARPALDALAEMLDEYRQEEDAPRSDG